MRPCRSKNQSNKCDNEQMHSYYGKSQTLLRHKQATVVGPMSMDDTTLHNWDSCRMADADSDIKHSPSHMGSCIMHCLPETHCTHAQTTPIHTQLSVDMYLAEDMSCLLWSSAYLSQPGLVTLCQQLAGLLVHLQSLFLEHTQAEALDVLLQLGNGVHRLDVAHSAVLACSPPCQCEPGLQEGQSHPRAPATPSTTVSGMHPSIHMSSM